MNARCIPPLFRAPFIKQAVAGRHKKVLAEVFMEMGILPERAAKKPLKEVLNDLYRILSGFYRCEYVLKNAVANALFLALHDPQEAYLTTEFRSGDSRADVVIFNGTSTVYEIKSEYDSFAKLGTQLADYRKIFDRICMVVPPSLLDRALSSASDDIGVFVVNQNLGVTKKRAPRSNKDQTSPSHIFDCMRRSEYEGAIREYTGCVPDVPNTRRFAACKEIFTKIPPRRAHDLMVRHIKNRSKNLAIQNLLSEIPDSLVHVCLTLSGSKAFINGVARVLNQPLGRL